MDVSHPKTQGLKIMALNITQVSSDSLDVSFVWSQMSLVLYWQVAAG